MKLTIIKFDVLPDWYLIERAEHDGREWEEPFRRKNYGGTMFMRSARLSPESDIEGTAEEMLEIAKAIRDRSKVRFKRCAVRITGKKAYFESPRNSHHEGESSLEEADELASLIEKMCGKKS